MFLRAKGMSAGPTPGWWALQDSLEQLGSLRMYGPIVACAVKRVAPGSTVPEEHQSDREGEGVCDEGQQSRAADAHPKQ